jgi:hypothetical protein
MAFPGAGGALRRIGTTEILLPVIADGFIDTGGQFYFEQADCSDPPIIAFWSGKVPLHFAPYETYSLTAAGVLYYPDLRTLKNRTLRRIGYIYPNGTQIAGCNTIGDPITYLTAQLTSVDLSTLGFVPPFQIK